MGEYYELQELAGVYYIVYQSKETAWASIAVELEPEQYRKITAFLNNQESEKSRFLKSVIKPD